MTCAPLHNLCSNSATYLPPEKSKGSTRKIKPRTAILINGQLCSCLINYLKSQQLQLDFKPLKENIFNTLGHGNCCCKNHAYNQKVCYCENENFRVINKEENYENNENSPGKIILAYFRIDNNHLNSRSLNKTVTYEIDCNNKNGSAETNHDSGDKFPFLSNTLGTLSHKGAAYKTTLYHCPCMSEKKTNEIGLDKLKKESESGDQKSNSSIKKESKKAKSSQESLKNSKKDLKAQKSKENQEKKSREDVDDEIENLLVGSTSVLTENSKTTSTKSAKSSSEQPEKSLGSESDDYKSENIAREDDSSRSSHEVTAYKNMSKEEKKEMQKNCYNSSTCVKSKKEQKLKKDAEDADKQRIEDAKSEKTMTEFDKRVKQQEKEREQTRLDNVISDSETEIILNSDDIPECKCSNSVSSSKTASKYDKSSGSNVNGLQSIETGVIGATGNMTSQESHRNQANNSKNSQSDGKTDQNTTNTVGGAEKSTSPIENAAKTTIGISRQSLDETSANSLVAVNELELESYPEFPTSLYILPVSESTYIGQLRKANLILCEGWVWKKRYFFSCLYHQRYFVLTKDAEFIYFRDPYCKSPDYEPRMNIDNSKEAAINGSSASFHPSESVSEENKKNKRADYPNDVPFNYNRLFDTSLTPGYNEVQKRTRNIKYTNSFWCTANPKFLTLTYDVQIYRAYNKDEDHPFKLIIKNKGWNDQMLYDNMVDRDLWAASVKKDMSSLMIDFSLISLHAYPQKYLSILLAKNPLCLKRVYL